MKERHRREESISSAMVIWNAEILPHWDVMYVPVATLPRHVCSRCVYLCVCVCAGKGRGASGSCGGRVFLPASGGGCGVSPSATSSTSQQVSGRCPLVAAAGCTCWPLSADGGLGGGASLCCGWLTERLLPGWSCCLCCYGRVECGQEVAFWDRD